MRRGIQTFVMIPCLLLMAFMSPGCNVQTTDARNKVGLTGEKNNMSLGENGSPVGPNSESVSCDTGGSADSNPSGGGSAVALGLTDTCSTCPTLGQLPDGIKDKISEVDRLFDDALKIRQQIVDLIAARLKELDPIKRRVMLEQIEALGIQYSNKIIALNGRRIALEGILRGAYPKCMAAYTQLLTRRLAQTGVPMFSTTAKILGVLGTVTCSALTTVVLDANTCYAAEPEPWRSYSCDELATELPEKRANKTSFCENLFWRNFGNPPTCQYCASDRELKARFEEQKLACEVAQRELDDLTEQYNRNCRGLD
ncbi:MAG: hypothetical protein RIQ81_2741 [Pseudomonadota bacterium]|jgi:hypothetical protein